MRPYRISSEGIGRWIDLDCVQSISDLRYDSIRYSTEISLILAFRDSPLVIYPDENIDTEGEPDDMYSAEYSRWWHGIGAERMRQRHLVPLLDAWKSK